MCVRRRGIVVWALEEILQFCVLVLNQSTDFFKFVDWLSEICRLIPQSVDRKMGQNLAENVDLSRLKSVDCWAWICRLIHSTVDCAWGESTVSLVWTQGNLSTASRNMSTDSRICRLIQGNQSTDWQFCRLIGAICRLFQFSVNLNKVTLCPILDHFIPLFRLFERERSGDHH